MTSRTRLFVLAVSIPVIVFAVLGGYLGRVMAQGDETFRHLRVFEDVVSLVVNNYVEPVDISEAMTGAMRGLADGLDPDSAYLSAELVRTVEANTSPGTGEVGLDVTRQYVADRGAGLQRRIERVDRSARHSERGRHPFPLEDENGGVDCPHPGHGFHSLELIKASMLQPGLFFNFSGNFFCK